MKLTTHLHLVPKSRMCVAVSPLPQYIFMARCSVKKEAHDNFALTFYIISFLLRTGEYEPMSLHLSFRTGKSKLSTDRIWIWPWKGNWALHKERCLSVTHIRSHCTYMLKPVVFIGFSYGIWKNLSNMVLFLVYNIQCEHNISNSVNFIWFLKM
jgi:hypothetical protein